MDYRCIIIKERFGYYIGKTYSGKIYKIKKNRFLKCKVGDDFYFYARKCKGLFTDKLIPISDREAGVAS